MYCPSVSSWLTKLQSAWVELLNDLVTTTTRFSLTLLEWARVGKRLPVNTLQIDPPLIIEEAILDSFVGELRNVLEGLS